MRLATTLPLRLVKRLHWMTLRGLPGPFLAWLGLLLFLFLMQFLMKYLPDIVGKGLALSVIVELIAYNLAYMAVLAVPMAALLATLMHFGQIAESNAYLVVKSAGVSLGQILWPSLVAGLLLTGAMAYFNNIVLPEANFRARTLWQDIRAKKPGFDLEPGIFYDGLSRYNILVGERAAPPEDSLLYDVTVYDYTEGTRAQRTLRAERGRIVPHPSGRFVDLVLEHGEVHQVQPQQPNEPERYERMRFREHRLRLDLSDFLFERSDPEEGYRSDRTTPTDAMVALVDSLQATIDEETARLYRLTSALAADSTLGRLRRDEPMPTPIQADTAAASPFVLAGLADRHQNEVVRTALREARSVRTQISDARRTIEWQAQKADRYRVEIHKKSSIALACLLFVLIGAPLGLTLRRGGLGVTAAVAMGLFLFYWVTLVQGEKLADRNLLVPWVGMWAANVVVGTAGALLLAYVALDWRAVAPPWLRLWRRLRRS